MCVSVRSLGCWGAALQLQLLAVSAPSAGLACKGIGQARPSLPPLKPSQLRGWWGRVAAGTLFSHFWGAGHEGCARVPGHFFHTFVRPSARAPRCGLVRACAGGGGGVGKSVKKV